ncbi:MAG: polysaccharide deacetylase family protein [Hyphomicrobium sp.]
MRAFAGACVLWLAMTSGASPAPICFAPDELKAAPGENIVKRHQARFDAAGAEAAPTPAAPAPPSLRGAIRRVELPPGEKLIALTLDLCEQRGEIAGYDGAIFDYLRREGVKATVFAGGKWMRSHEARTRQLIADPLFEMANHGDTHRNLRLLDAVAMRREILGAQAAYEKARAKLAAQQCLAPATLDALPARMSLFRFPFGACSKAALDAVNDAGLLAIQWDISTGDPDKQRSARAIARAMVSSARPGSIIIAHANGRGWNTAAALPIAIPKLKALGFTFVTVSELLARGKPVIAATCYNARPGDTNRYDFLFAGRAREASSARDALRATVNETAR